ncbi:MAG: hypothetical protein R6W88_13500 [Desulfobacterales bacterium]
MRQLRPVLSAGYLGGPYGIGGKVVCVQGAVIFPSLRCLRHWYFQ